METLIALIILIVSIVVIGMLIVSTMMMISLLRQEKYNEQVAHKLWLESQEEGDQEEGKTYELDV